MAQFRVSAFASPSAARGFGGRTVEIVMMIAMMIVMMVVMMIIVMMIIVMIMVMLDDSGALSFMKLTSSLLPVCLSACLPVSILLWFAQGGSLHQG